MARTEVLLADFPKTWTLDEGTKVTVRPMVPGDRAKVARFFQGIPEGDLRFLKDDVRDPRVLDQWVQQLNYDRVLRHSGKCAGGEARWDRWESRRPGDPRSPEEPWVFEAAGVAMNGEDGSW